MEKTGGVFIKILILYVSSHHGNTKEVVQAMAEAIGADLADLAVDSVPDLAGYDLIGLASGVYFGTLHEKILTFAAQADFLPTHRVFLTATCGVGYRDYTRGVKKLLAGRNVSCLGSFQCRGYDTFGIWEKIGGIAKGHPSQRDLVNAQSFIRRIAVL